MRNPKRINRILRLIKKIWIKNSDLRLGQLIDNAIREETIFYIEDDAFEVCLKKYYKIKGGE